MPPVTIEQRLLYSGLTALVLGLLMGPATIAYLRRLKVGQTVRDDGPASHLKKSGTPTMGGVLFIFPVAVAVLIWSPAAEFQAILAWLWLVLGFGLIGFMDDYIKVVKRQSLGLRAREKLIGQFLVGTVFYFMLRHLGISPTLSVPFTDWSLNLGWLYWPFIVFVSTAEANAVNLTDGIDGLCGTTFLIATVAFLVVASTLGVPAVALTAATLIGGLLAFLRLNWHPAKVFMGDVGSLALGGALTGMAVLSKTELLLVPIGLVFLLEVLSDIIQVTYFRYSGGKRVFRMAPVHHHFELSGWSEQKIVAVWCTINIIGGIVGLLSLSIR